MAFEALVMGGGCGLSAGGRGLSLHRFHGAEMLSSIQRFSPSPDARDCAPQLRPVEYFPILSLAICFRQSSVLQKKPVLPRVHMALLLTIIAGTASLLALDAGCYLLLRANGTRRYAAIRHITRRRNPQVGSA